MRYVLTLSMLSKKFRSVVRMERLFARSVGINLGPVLDANGPHGKQASGGARCVTGVKLAVGAENENTKARRPVGCVLEHG